MWETFSLRKASRSRVLSPADHLPAKAHNIVVDQLGGAGLLQRRGLGQIAAQPQNPVVAPQQHGGAPVQLRVLLPPLRRGQALQRGADVPQALAQLAGNLAENSVQLDAGVFRFI